MDFCIPWSQADAGRRGSARPVLLLAAAIGLVTATIYTASIASELASPEVLVDNIEDLGSKHIYSSSHKIFVTLSEYRFY